MPFKSYRQESKTDWGVTVTESTKLDREQLALGAILRIADATELMAVNYRALQEERDRYKRNWEYAKAQNERMARRVSALQGVVTKMKKKAP